MGSEHDERRSPSTRGPLPDETLPAPALPLATQDTVIADPDATLAAHDSASPTGPLPGAAPVEAGQRYRALGEHGTCAAAPGTKHPVIGAGGVGRVLGAYDTHLHRPVALKELLRHGAGSGTQRFLREARVTAKLQHPSIVPVYELGQSADGRPFYTMKLVKGRTLAEAIEACTSSTQRLALLGHFVNLCQALAYAHEQGVVHRDIKPANVMVGEFGETIVLDWGLAKLAEGEPATDDEALASAAELMPETEPTVATEPKTKEGSVMGTPAYMSPEQARGEVERVDARSDTWALGLVLFELLSGRRAIEGPNTITVLAKAQTGEVLALAELCPELPRELVAIVERALQMDPDARYPDAGTLAEDVEAFRTGALVKAHNYTAAERLRRFVSRHRHAVGVGLVAALALLVGGTIAIWRVVAERDRARAAEQIAQQQRQVAVTRQAEAQEQRALAEVRREQALAQLSDSLVVQAHTAWDAGHTSVAWLLAAEALSLGERPDARGVVLGASRMWTPRYLGTRTLPLPCPRLRSDPAGSVLACEAGGKVAVIPSEGQALVRELPPLPGARTGAEAGNESRDIVGFAVAPGGERVAVSSAAGELGVLNMDTGQWQATTLVDTSQPTTALAFSPDGAYLYGVAGRWNLGERLTVWGVERAEVLATRPNVRNAGLTVSPDGAWLAVPTRQGLDLLDAKTLEHLRHIEVSGGSPHSPRASPDGTRLAVATHDGGVWLLDTSTWEQPKSTPGAGGPGTLAWSSSGELLLDTREDRSVRVLDGHSGEPVFTLPERRGQFGGANFAPSGDALWVQTTTEAARIWELDGSESRAGAFGREGVGPGLALAPDGQTLVTCSNKEGRRAQVWRGEDGAAIAQLGGPARLPQFSADGSALFMLLDEQVVRFDPSTWTGHELFAPPSTNLLLLDGGETFATVSADGELVVWDTAGAQAKRRLPLPGGHPWPRPTGGSRLLTFADQGRGLVSLDTQTGALSPVVDLSAEPLSLRISSNASFAIVGFVDGHAMIYDLVNEVVVRRWKAHDHWTARVAVSNDGQWAATAAKDSKVHLWSVPDGQLRASMTAHDQRVLGLRFDHDSARLLSIDSAGVILPWDIGRANATAEELLSEAQARFGARAQESSERPHVDSLNP